MCARVDGVMNILSVFIVVVPIKADSFKKIYYIIRKKIELIKDIRFFSESSIQVFGDNIHKYLIIDSGLMEAKESRIKHTMWIAK